MPQITSEHLRVLAVETDGHYHIEFDCREDGEWTTVLATGLWTPPGPFNSVTEALALVCEDPVIEWRDGSSESQVRRMEAVFSDAATDDEGRTLTVSGQAGCHRIEEGIRIADLNRIRVTVTDLVAEPAGAIEVGQLLSQFYFVPRKRAARSAEPLDFAWLPNLHKKKEHVCGDHFFRSPAVIVQAEGFYAALVPDLDLFAQHRAIGHALDLRVTETPIEAPRLSYGLCCSVIDGHTYTKHETSDTQVIDSTALCYGFDLFYGRAESVDEVIRFVTTYLWDTYGRRALQDIRPQVLPFEEYGRRYTYVQELPAALRTVTIDGQRCAGIHNPRRGGAANFQAWENDLHVAYGIRHYADKWRDQSLRQTADRIMQLSLAAPRNRGAFPCMYNFEEGRYEGTLSSIGRAVDSVRGYDSAAMGVTAWWQLAWHQDLDARTEILGSVVQYARFLAAAQLPSGAVPTYFSAELTPEKQLLESATTAMSGAVLATVARLTGDAELAQVANRAGAFVRDRIVPGLVFNDFETYYSCSAKPLHAIDYWTGIRPHNNLSIQWACDQFLGLYRLTGDDEWLCGGQYLLNILSLYQQVWTPSHLSGYLFGGFGVMNTDGEWSDGRQTRFVSTYADYYEATGKVEYLERAVAACRASFALMDISENHDNEINQIVIAGGPGLGYAPENIHHLQGRPTPPEFVGDWTGPDWRSGGGLPASAYLDWTGLNWASGGGLAASAYLERRFGGVCVDGQLRRVIAIDGVAAAVDGWDEADIHLKIASALNQLPRSYEEPWEIRVTFTRLSRPAYTVSINGERLGILARDELERGIMVPVGIA